MEPITIPLYNSEGKKIDSIKLDGSIFAGEVNTAVLYQYVNAFLSSQRDGLACAKTRGAVSGGGKKPWRQKGTGRARVGSSRTPLWRHGGVTFGPVPRSFSIKIPSKIKNQALCSALRAKVKSEDILALEDLKIEKPKTKEAVKIFLNLKLNGAKKNSGMNVLLLLGEKNSGIIRALRNVSFIQVNLASSTNAYEVMAHKKIVVTKEAVEVLTKRLRS